MRVLLLTSPAPGKKEYGFYLGEKRFPLGLGYIASNLLKHGVEEVVIHDLYAKDRNVRFKRFDIIGIYVNTICFKRGTLPLIQRIRNSGYNKKIVVGGPHTSVLPYTLTDMVDHVVQGEGEEVMLNIVNGALTEKLIVAPRIQDIDELPRPAYNQFRLPLYNLSFEEDKSCKRVFTYSSSRGCPYACTFCSAKNIYHRKWTAHSAERVIDDIAFLRKTYHVDGIYFREDNFTVNKNRVREICELILKKGIKVKWKCETRVDIDSSDLKLMRKAGCSIVYVGFESGSPRLLEIYKKNIKVEQARKFANTCKKLGIFVYGSFVVGTPWETPDDTKLTNRFIESLKLDRVCKNKYLAMPGSEMYEDILKNPELLKRNKTVLIKM